MKVNGGENAVLVWALAVLAFCFLPGCEKRELIEPTPGMRMSERFWIRVLLFDNIRECRLAAGPDLFANGTDHRGRIDLDRTNQPIEIRIVGGKIVAAGQVFGKEVSIEPEKPFVFTINNERYRGNLHLTVNSDGKSFDAVNVVPVEAYLAGVVGAEMPAYWEPEALKAQAIAARTYCLYVKQKTGSNRNWDVRKTQAHQVYRGLAAESVTVWDAVNKTSGKVLHFRDTDGREKLFPTYYSSTCGGHTENSKHVFGDSYTPLAGVDCPYCRPVTKKSFLSWDAVEFETDKVSSQISARYPKLKKLGTIKSIEAVKKSDHSRLSRITLVKLTGKNGKSDFLRGEDLRLTIDPSGNRIKSASCRISNLGDKFRFYDGKGYGHGVGMCQYGAEGMARKGYRARAILAYYYPTSRIKMLY